MANEKEEEKDPAKLFDGTLHMVAEDKEFAELSKRLSVFSPFEALGVVDYEIRHGNFLAHLFNPSAPHGFGNTVLKTFLKQLFSTSAHKQKMAQVVFEDIEPVLIHREWHDIDIVIELRDPKLKAVIAIELKLHASEHGQQLEKYHKLINERPAFSDYEKIFVFMTPEGTASSHQAWVDFNMTDGFIQALKLLDSGEEMANAMLTDYVRIMEQKFMTDKQLESLAETMWARYPDVLNFLADNRPASPLNRVFQHLSNLDTEKIYKALDEIGFDLSGDWDHESSRFLIYTFANWDKFPVMLTGTDKRTSRSGRLFWLEIEKDRQDIRARFVIGPGDQGTRRNLLKAFIQGEADHGWQTTVDDMASGTTRLGSKKLATVSEAEEDITKAEGKAIARLQSFLTEQLPLLDEAIQSAMSEVQEP